MESTTFRGWRNKPFVVAAMAATVLGAAALLLFPARDGAQCPPSLAMVLTDHFGFDHARKIASDIAGRIKSGTLRAPNRGQATFPSFVPYGQIPKRLVQAYILAELGAASLKNPPHLTGGRDCITATLPVFSAQTLWTLVTGERSYSPVTVSLVTDAAQLLPDESGHRSRMTTEAAAFLLERSDAVTWEQIVEHAMNLKYFGVRAYGIAAASETYFGKRPVELSLAQIAYLAGLSEAPNNYHPVRGAERAVRRRNHVIDLMLSAGLISADEALAAKAEPFATRLR